MHDLPSLCIHPCSRSENLTVNHEDDVSIKVNVQLNIN